MLACERCGRPVEDLFRFCTTCSAVRSKERQARTAARIAAEDEALAREVIEERCQNCGTVMPGQSRRGSQRITCSPRCRTALYRRRGRDPDKPVIPRKRVLRPRIEDDDDLGLDGPAYSEVAWGSQREDYEPEPVNELEPCEAQEPWEIGVVPVILSKGNN